MCTGYMLRITPSTKWSFLSHKGREDLASDEVFDLRSDRDSIYLLPAQWSCSLRGDPADQPGAGEAGAEEDLVRRR
jgi:hypothetical protein